MTTIVPLCVFCKHYREFETDKPVRACSAYPNGIPKEITDGKVDHRVPYRGDGGVVFEAYDRFGDEDVADLYGAKEGA